MPASFPELLNSRIFKFIVGETVDGTATEFFVHEEAIAQLSTPLHSLMRGGMTESQEGCAKWDDVSKETFERFAQFAYTGDYSVPVGEKRKPRTEANGKGKGENGVTGSIAIENSRDYETVPAEDKLGEVTFDDWNIPRDWGLSSSASRKNKKSKKILRDERVLEPKLEDVLEFSRDKYPERHPFNLSTDFHSLSFSSNLAPRNNYATTCEPSETFHPDLNYTTMFIAHATLYILADYRLVDSLKALALYKLHKTLCTFQLSANNADDVLNLARYVYADEGGSEGSGKEDGTVGELRALVCRYLAMHALVMVLDEGFMDLLAEGGQFVKDFFRFEVQRVVS